MYNYIFCIYFFFFNRSTSYKIRISDWSSDVCSSVLEEARPGRQFARLPSLPRHREHARAEAEQQQHAEQVEAAHRARSAPDSLRTSHSASTSTDASPPAIRISNGHRLCEEIGREQV